MKLKELPLIKHYQGYILTQIAHTDKAAIYEQTDKEKSFPAHYEVIRIKTKKLPVIKDVYSNLNDQGYTHREVYPHSEQWGLLGWTYMDLESAMVRYNSLNAAENKK